jgi:hypothetical protein
VGEAGRGKRIHVSVESVERYERERKHTGARAAKGGSPKPAAVKAEPVTKPATTDAAVLFAKLEGYALGLRDDTLAQLVSELREATNE